MNEISSVIKPPKVLRITVVVPVYNAVRTIKDCLWALKNQTDSHYEVILVDDCSSDTSLEICRQSGFKTLSLPVNKGQAVARNAGVKESTGEIIAFIDSDAVAPFDWIEKYRCLLDKYGDADMICSGYALNRDDTQPALFAFYESCYRRMNIPAYIHSSTSSNCVIYKKAFEEIGGYPEYYICPNKDKINQKAVATNEDAELGFLLSRMGKKIVWSHDNPVVHYFRQTWEGYLKQQISFSRYAIVSIFRFPKMLSNEDIYSSEPILPQIIIVPTIVLALLGLFWGYRVFSVTASIAILCLVLFYLIHRKFIYYLRVNLKTYPSFKLFFWLFLARLAWIYGIILGLKDGCIMLINLKGFLIKEEYVTINKK